MDIMQNKDREIEVIRDSRKETLQIQSLISNARSTKFTDDSFSDYETMKYEKSNEFALAYYNMPGNAQKLQCAGLVCVYNINKIMPLSDEELQNGFWVSAPITHVGKLMGLNVEDKKNKSFYRTIKTAAQQVVKSTVTIEDARYQSFDTFSVINRILYNPLNDGRVYFHFTGGTSQYYLNNVGNFTVYSLILNNHAEEKGKSGIIRMIEVLKTNLFKAQRSPQGKVNVYYDYVDLRCKLSMIDTGDERVLRILNDKNYAMYEHNDAVAYERILAIEQLDKGLENVIDGRSLKSTQYNDFKNFRRIVLEPSQKTFLQCIKDCPDLMDMMFEYTPKRYKDRVIGLFFSIYTVDAYKKKELEQGVQMSLFEIMDAPSEKNAVRIEEIEDPGMAEKVSGDVARRVLESVERKKNKEDIGVTLAKLEQYFKSRDDLKYQLTITDYYTLAKKAPASVIIDKYELMEQDNGVRNPLKWMLAAIKEDYKSAKEQVKSKPKTSTQNQFQQFQQNKYDFDALEYELLVNK